MKLVKLLNVLPQSAPGNRETHFGQMCEIRGDGVYCELEDGLADLFVSCNRAKLVEVVKAVEPAKAVVEAAKVVEPVIGVLQEVQTVEPVVEATEQGAALGFGTHQEEPETIASKMTGKRGPKPKNV